MTRLSTLERFERKVTISHTGCWLWRAARQREGYAVFSAPRYVLGHRWAYEYFVGPIPQGLEIDHLCRVRHCVNPAHLEPVTGAENRRRAALAHTHCLRGHPRTPDNLLKSAYTKACEKYDAAGARYSEAFAQMRECMAALEAYAPGVRR